MPLARNFTVSVLCFALSLTAAAAGQIGTGGVESIADNGKINGDQSWTVDCSSGWAVVRRHGNAWADNTANTFSQDLWSLTIEQLAEVMCS